MNPNLLFYKGVVAGVLLAACFLLTKNNHAMMLNRFDGSTITQSHIPLESMCESPSIPKGRMHIVVGGYNDTEKGVSFSGDAGKNYLWDLGLTNTDVMMYRRLDPHKPLKLNIEGPCGMTMHEKLLIPNHGRDPAAFYSYVTEYYHNLPDYIVFLHGHGAKSWHAKCEAVFARTIYYYRAIAQRSVNPNVMENQKRFSVTDFMMTLTAGGDMNDFRVKHSWFGFYHGAPQTPQTPQISKPEEIENFQAHLMEYCAAYLLPKWADLMESNFQYNPYRSCCASFILPAERILRYPYEFWEDLKIITASEPDDQKLSRVCFEYIIYELLHDDHDISEDEAQHFYDEADSLILGKARNPNSNDADSDVVQRVKSCLAT